MGHVFNVPVTSTLKTCSTFRKKRSRHISCAGYFFEAMMSMLLYEMYPLDFR